MDGETNECKVEEEGFLINEKGNMKREKNEEKKEREGLEEESGPAV